MKQLRMLASSFLALVLCIGLGACGTQAFLPGPAAAASAPSFNDQAGKALQEITLARQAARQAMVSKLITVDQEIALRLTLDTLKQQFVDAQFANLTDPARGAKLLADALAALAAYQGAHP